MSDDTLFTQTAELSSKLKWLKAEKRMLSFGLRAYEGYETRAGHDSNNDASTLDESRQLADEVEQLNELRAEAWETEAELEPQITEFAKSEFARLESLSEAIPGRDLGAVCSAAVQAVITRYVRDFGSLLSKNNNVAHLLVRYSSHLDPDDQSGSQSAAMNRPDVMILRDEDGSRCRGVRVDNQEVRFINVAMAVDEFQSTVLKAVEDWKQKRLVRVERRAELRKQLGELN